MRKIYIILLSSAFLSGCDLISDIVDEDDDCRVEYKLYGMSNFDEALHFVSVDPTTGKLTSLRKLEGIEGVRGQVTANPELKHYYFTSENEFIVVNTADGKIIKRFPLEYPNTGNIQYNANSKNINGISYFDGKFHYMEIDLENEKMNTVKILPIEEIYGSSANIDAKNNKYYFQSFRTIYVLDLETGEVIDTMSFDKNIGGLCLIDEDVLFGIDLSLNNFSIFDVSNETITKIHSFQGNVSGQPSVDVELGMYYYFSDHVTLQCIDINSGKTKKTFSFPYSTFNILPL